MRSVKDLRAESRRLRERIKKTSDPAVKQELASQALDLALRAEAIANASTVELLQANIDRYRRILLADDGKSEAHKQTIETMLSEAGEMLQKITRGFAA
jgi:hypothetical protein